MSEFSMALNSAFSDIVKKYNKFQLSNHTKSSIIEGNNILHDGVAILGQLKTYTNALETLLSDCQDFIEEVEADLSQKPRKEDYVYHTHNGMLSYLGRDLIIKNKTSVEKEQKNGNVGGNVVGNTTSNTTISPQPIERVLIDDIGYYMKLPIVSDVKKIQPMFCWFKGDSTYQPGIYCCICPGVYTKVPFPETIDSTKEYNKGRSIRCKYKSKVLCDDQRSKMAKYHESQVRICNFAHVGEKIVKIGYPSRCASVPSFGNPATLTNDIKIIDLDSIKNILLYGLSDTFISAVYFDYTKNNGLIMDKLATA
jgi:hypothetical protein